MKFCNKCYRELPCDSDHFYKDKSKGDGFRGTCKECRGSKFTFKLRTRDGYKVCNVCEAEKPRTREYFWAASNCKDGLRGECKECSKKQASQYYEENKEVIAEKGREYRQANKEKILERNRVYRQKNREKYLEYGRQYYEENKERFAEISKLYRQENKEEISKYNKKYYKENKAALSEYGKNYYKENKVRISKQKSMYAKKNLDQFRKSRQKRDAKKRRLPRTLTIEQWISIKKDFNNSCAYCGATEESHIKETGEQLHQEHFIPISEGGEYTHNNIIPSCRSCNCSKGDRDFFEWYPVHENYNEDRERIILEYLGYTEDTQQLSIL